MARSQNRRDFLKRTAFAAGVSPFLANGFPAVARGWREDSPNEKVRFACIGVGGKGDSDTNDAGSHGEIIALCDVDSRTLGKKAEKFPNAKKYSDYRKLLEELGNKIDAVTVSTPDHTHAPASIMAMRMGKHCFCQKPLTWSIEEARLMRTLAREKNLCTQMGNQGTADGGFRTGVEVIRSGVLGTVKEIHVWTNRPIWPQGIPRPAGSDPVPEWLNWNVWLGAAPERPYKSGTYHPFNWRGWLDFGTGAIGDMACHTVNVACMGLRLFDAKSAEVVDTSGIVEHETYPKWSILRSHFAEVPARQPAGPRPGVVDLVRGRRQPAGREARLQGVPPRREGRGQRPFDRRHRRARSTRSMTTAASTPCCPATSSRSTRSPSRPCRARTATSPSSSRRSRTTIRATPCRTSAMPAGSPRRPSCSTSRSRSTPRSSGTRRP